ncbi:MAG: SRPBCC family protein [Solirubrobacterales bacterium]|nr:SRPBCC family protein [Solirubrobacterales bacterium]
MDPVTADVLIARPPEEVFAYLTDVANHPEFMGHFTRDWHLTREDTVGLGAGVRFAFAQRRTKFPWVDQTIHELEAPRRITLVGRTGKFNRIRTLTEWELEPASGGGTKVTVSFEKVPKLPSDRLVEGKRFHKAKWRKTVKVLRDVLEGEREAGPRATIAGGARKPATGFHFAAPARGVTK